MTSTSYRVAIATSSFGSFDEAPLARLEAAGCSLSLNPYGRKLTADEVVALAADADGLIAGTEPLSADVLERLPRLRVLSRCGAGMENVDQEAARRFSILVRSTPDGPTLAVAELAVGLILNLLRGVRQMNEELRRGVWKKRMGGLLQGKTVGIVGLGRIGQKVARLLLPFGVQIVYSDVRSVDCDLKAMRLPMDELLQRSQVVSLHCSQPKAGAALIGERELKRMPSGSFLVNLARGGLVDETALARALVDGHLAGAALDVFATEPYGEGPLTGLDTVILTPHIGSYAREARVAMELEAVENLLAGFSEAIPS